MSMKSHRIIVALLFISMAIGHVTGQERDPRKEVGVEEPVISPRNQDPSVDVDDNKKEPPVASLSDNPDKPRAQTNYSEPRFASLFNSKARRPRLPPVKHTMKAKPTLPPFIKNPPSVKVTTDEPAVTRPARTARTTSRPTARTTTSSRRGRGRDSIGSVVATTESSRKGRRYGSDTTTPRNSTRTRSRS